MDRTDLIVDYLIGWQGEEMMAEKEVDIKAFNAVGSIVHLLRTGIMSTASLHDFVDLLSLDEAGKEKLTDIIVKAYDYANKTKEEIVNG